MRRFVIAFNTDTPFVKILKVCCNNSRKTYIRKWRCGIAVFGIFDAAGNCPTRKHMKNHNLGHSVNAAKGAVDTVKELAPLAEKKSPLVAAVLGVFFGAIGIGIYFRSWKDFFICVLLFIGLTIIIPGLGAFPGWLFAAAYGAYRAHTSNENAGY